MHLLSPAATVYSLTGQKSTNTIQLTFSIVRVSLGAEAVWGLYTCVSAGAQRHASVPDSHEGKTSHLNCPAEDAI